MSEEPELHVIRFSDLPGAEAHRARIERDRQEARRRYREYLAPVLDASGVSGDVDALADAVLEALVSWSDVETHELCRCSCHPQLPGSDFHDFGFACPCTQIHEDRRRSWERWRSQLDAFWDSPEGRRLSAARRAEEAKLEVWLSNAPEVTVRSHGGLAPEQWTGEVDGHSFYFRERHDEWRIEVDLRPVGRFSRVWIGGDLDDESSFESREIEEGEIIAEGTTRASGYGRTPVERLRFIVETIRTHLRRQDCVVHANERYDLELLFGRPLAWCPACGARLA